MPSNRPRVFLILVVLVFMSLAACRDGDQTTVPPQVTVISATPVPATVTPTTAPPQDTAPESAVTPTDEPQPSATSDPTRPLGADLVLVPGVTDYNLGDATITQQRFSTDSRFHDMPVRLEGLIAVPDETGQPAPVALILHGNHAGCPASEEQHGVDPWPCSREEEQLNYRGFDYLARALADEGYLVIAPNINAEFTLGFGEGEFGERIEQIIRLHLGALAAANSGGENGFGVPLQGQVDLSRLAIIGHSMGGELANFLTRTEAWDSPYALADQGFGPVDGLLHVAPSNNNVASTGGSVAMAALLPACDGDVTQLSGQSFFEALRQIPEFDRWAATVLIERGNHNGFNRILRSDRNPIEGCETVLPAEDQQAFLVNYARDFLATLWAAPPQSVEAGQRLGLDAAAPAPAALYGLPVRAVTQLPERLPLLSAVTEEEVETATIDGRLRADGIDVVFCPTGFFSSFENPLAEPCRRVNTTVPGNPAALMVSWREPGGALHLALPDGATDVSAYTSLRLRAAVDPLSALNETGQPQSFSIHLTDAAGQSAVVTVPSSDPALQYPLGEIETSDFLEDGIFFGILHMADIRIPLEAFNGIDLTTLTAVDVLFDQTGSGSLMMADVEFIRPDPVIGAYSTLLQNAAGAYDDLKAVARFNGAATCTAAFIDAGGGPDAPAYLISNGHCAQEWDDNAVYIDLPGNGMTAVFNHFIDTTDAAVEAPADRVAYSTMKGRDLAIIELAATVGELAQQGITPIPLAAAAPEAPFTARVIGAPSTGVPAGIAYLREEWCTVSGTADLFEFIWHFDDTWRTGCQDIYGGSSGSPVFAADGEAIVALINTTNLGGVTPCAAGVPCEAGPDGTALRPNTSYAIPVAGLGACFSDGRFDLTLNGCPLDDGVQLTISGTPAQPIQPTVEGTDGQTRPATWNAILSGTLPYYRYKIGPAGAVDCHIEAGYSEIIPLANRQTIDEPLPATDGSEVLCVVAGNSPTVDESWQPVAAATIVRAEIDTTPPVLEPYLNIVRFGADVSVEPIFAIPELSDFSLKVGPAGATDCADESDYFPYRRIPTRIAATDLPATVCVIGRDVAGNASPPVEHDIQPLPPTS